MIPNFLKTGCRILMMIKRKKDGCKDLSNCYRKCIRRITSCPEQFDAALDELSSMRNTNERIYSSINGRNMPKAIRMFKERQLQNDYESIENKEAFYLDIQNRFLSCLQNPSCKASTYFLIDVDHKLMDKIEATKDILKKYTEIIFEKETINGFHLITKPFNPTFTDFMNLEIKKDAMLFLEGGNNDSTHT